MEIDISNGASGVSNTAVAKRPPQLKSRVTNGRRVFALGGDGRGAWVRRWKDVIELHVADCGGQEHMSEAQLSLARRAATLSIQLEQFEAAMSEGKEVDLDLYARVAGHLRRILESLGLKRVAKNVTSDANVLADYFAKPITSKRDGHA